MEFRILGPVEVYLEEGHSLCAMARILGVTLATVRRQLAVHGIPLRGEGRRRASRPLLERLYVARSSHPARSPKGSVSPRARSATT